MSAYSDYLDELRSALHDSTDQFWSAPNKLGYINKARDRVVRDTGCYRVLQGRSTPCYLSTGVEVYPFGGVSGFNVTAGGTGYTSAPAVGFTPASGDPGSGAAATATVSGGAVTQITVTNPGAGYLAEPTVGLTGGGGAGAAALATILNGRTFDVVNMTIWWGNSRQVLARKAWSWFNAYARYYVNYLGPPSIFSVYSYNSLFAAKIPDQPYRVEWDSVYAPPAIVDATTVEVIPFPFKDAVVFYAAYLAKMKEQSWGEADQFMKQYNGQVLSAINSSFTRILTQPYASR